MKAIKGKIPWTFLLLGFALSWAIWIPVAITGRDYQSSPCLLTLVLVGAFGPGLAAIILNYLYREKEDPNDFRQRIFDLRRIRPSWLLIILALWPALHGVAVGITHLTGRPLPESPFLQEMLGQPSAIPMIIFMYFLQAGLEEIGWRGYLQEKLGRVFRPAGSSLLVGAIHAVWHLPLFWMVGTNQYQMGFGADFWIFILFVISSAVFSAWCYYGNNRSVLAVTLLHTVGNLSFDIFGYAPGTTKHLVFVLLSALGAALVIIHFQTTAKKTLPQSETSPD